MSRRRLIMGVVAAVLVVAIPIVATSCERARDAAEVASQEFRMRLARGAYAEIVQSATPEFRSSTTESAFAKAMEDVKERLGGWQSSEEPTWRVLAGTRGQTVTLVYDSRFERGKAIEEFVWRVERGRPILGGYHVKSYAAVAQ